MLKDIEGYEEKDNLLWYSLNECNEIMSEEEIEDSISILFQILCQVIFILIDNKERIFL